ncbi:unnamed protein product [Rhizoctonia solani]|uniref:C2H2-type domain-containing protein n=1 Tax=Rhizoctonia solani TaxID=456999 RepID=A0A8H3C4I5_9AGAM|nr:unnamed protein product [Rhizoctonia solani]
MTSPIFAMKFKQEPLEDVAAKVEVEDEESKINNLRLKISTIKFQPEIDEPSSPTPDTPACKGYVIESDFAAVFLGGCYYFIAPVQPDRGSSDFAVFSLSPDRRIVSFVDTNSSFHHHHIDQSFGPIIHFMIGDLPYQWDIQRGTLSFEQVGVGLSVSGLTLSDVQLYKSLEEAKALVDSLRYVNMTTLANLALDSPPLTNSNTSSPPNIADLPPTFTGVHLFESPPGTGYFGLSPSQENIDRWVDDYTKTDHAIRDGANLKCPEAGCDASSRRPHALKTHLYTHYRIKPYACKMCNISVLTEANLLRHMKNAHTCPGCHIVKSIPAMKAHKAVCPLTAPSERKAGKHGRTRTWHCV